MNNWLAVLLILIIAAVVCTFAHVTSLLRARREYQAALRRLKQDPSSPDTRREALARGTRYSALIGNWRGVAVFDEVALMNDINAACAAVIERPRPASLPDD